MTMQKFSADMAMASHDIFKRLINRQSEKGLTTEWRAAYLRDEILHPLMEALDEKYDGRFEDLDIPLGQYIKELVLNNHCKRECDAVAVESTIENPGG